MKYLDDVWLNKYKEMFGFVWIDQHLKFGQQTSSRLKFVGAINQFVKSQHTMINESFEKSMIVSKHEHKFSCFDLLWGNVSLKALDILVEELQRVHQVNSSNCGCKLQNSCVYRDCIPLESIDVFWRKLKISPSILMENEDICGDGKFEIKTHIRELAIQKNMCGRPSLKKQKHKQTDSINQAPRRRNFSTMSKSVELNNREPARHSSYITTIPDLNVIPDLTEISDLKEEPDLNEIPDEELDLNEISYLKEERQSCYNHQLIDEIQVMFHPYITHIQDVEGDGNCGFRAIFVCLAYGEDDWLHVRRQLLDKLLNAYDAYANVFTDGISELYTSLNFLQSSAPTRHWLLMPETSILIANRFGVVLTFLTKQGSLTFFPLWKGPKEFLYNRVIPISLIYEGDCPLPPISAFWIRHKAIYAVGWETMFMSRLELYKQSYNPEAHLITI
uniref:OTU domain-containing protein n=1 Tax=Lactuca sativa TaxID=4236 RepID=A0A9R1W9A0_LACSA|nr:hypothetical protein LSAT_V11C300112950 [Lactuca sativa]